MLGDNWVISSDPQQHGHHCPKYQWSPFDLNDQGQPQPSKKREHPDKDLEHARRLALGKTDHHPISKPSGPKQATCTRTSASTKSSRNTSTSTSSTSSSMTSTSTAK